jgi:hypothetical protein
MEDVIITALMDQFGVIIIDHPPGLFGISTSSLNIILDQIANHDNHKAEKLSPTRLDKLCTVASIIGPNENITVQAFLMTTPDPSDYRALLPSLSWFFKKREGLLPVVAANGGIDMILNKAGTKSEGRFDSALEMNRIFEDLSEFPDSRTVDSKLISTLRERAKKVGALACGYVANFDMNQILPSIQYLENRKAEEFTGIVGWCRQVGRSSNLYQDESEVALPTR